MKKSVWITISKAFTAVLTVITAFLFTGGAIAMENTAAISNTLGSKTQIVLNKETGEEVDTLYYKSKFSSVKQVIENSEKAGENVVAEGSVLLRNENKALPFAKGDTISLFSASSINLAVGGGGSSATSASSLNLKETLTDPSVGLNINEDLWKWYEDNKDTYGRKAGTSIGVAYSIADAKWTDIPEAIRTKKAKSAVFVLSRLGSENTDIRPNTEGFTPTDGSAGDPTDLKNGNYLEMTDRELDFLRALKAEKDKGTFESVVLILNMANQVELGFIDKEEFGVDAAVWCGTLGSTGAKAIANILVGSVNPSGRLADTFWAEHRFNPVHANFGRYSYNGNTIKYGGTHGNNPAGGSPSKATMYDHTGVYYVVYREGIYNGYRYTETRYEDKVLGAENVGEYDYNSVVKYPFGFGLSYTNFEYSDYSVAYNEKTDCYDVTVKVTNVGEKPGKEVVQVYLQKPYTDYDKEHGVEKAAVELAGFAKTKILGKGESQTVTINVEKKYFASYDSSCVNPLDETKFGAYILEKGDYYLSVGKDCHDALNNILAAKEKTKADGMTDGGDATFAIKIDDVTENFDAKTYSTDDSAIKSGLKKAESEDDKGAIISNKFDDVDINRYEGRGDNRVEYTTRKNWNGTTFFGFDEDNNFTNQNVKLNWTEKIEYDVFEIAKDIPADNVKYPTYGSTETSYNLIDLRVDADGNKIAYDDPMWDALLDQMTWQDYVELLSCGERMTAAVASIGKPVTIDHNGAVGVNQRYGANSGANRGYALANNDPDANKVPPAYPCNALVAATYNVELMAEYGEAWGEDALWAGYAGLYGPGINMHRGAYGGRTFEYYSEDSFLSGKICAPICKGIEEKGVYVYLKHCFLNEQETNRQTVCTWANEQTVRECYLRAFEIAIKEGGASNVMLGLNIIGPKYTGVHGFCNTVLRDEFGMTGFVVSDFQDTHAWRRMPLAHMNGMDIPDRNYSSYKDIYTPYQKNHGAVAWAMRESAHKILYTVVHSATMNGISSNTEIIKITPDWINLLGLLESVTLTLTILSWALLITLYAFPFISDKAKLAYAFITDKVKNENRVQKVKEGVKASVVAGEKAAAKVGKFPAYTARKEDLSAIITRSVALVAAVVVLITSLVGFNGVIAKNNALIKLEEENNAKNAVLDETRMTENDGLKAYRFEAESGSYVGWQKWGETEEEREKLTAEALYLFSPDFSGGIAMSRNMRAATAGTNSFTFKFNSDKKVKVNMRVNINCVDSWITEQGALDSVFNFKVNGKKVKSNAMTPAKADCVKKSDGSKIYYMGNAVMQLTLIEGENEIILENCGGDQAFKTFDYIEIVTSAEITGYEPKYLDTSNLQITKTPTLTDEGEIKGWYKFTIPSLEAGVKSGLYTYEDTDEAIAYKLVTDGRALSKVEKNERVLTIDSEYAFFAPDEDGVMASSKIVVATTRGLPSVIVRAPKNRRLAGWAEVGNPSNYFTKDTFVMPDRNISVEPCFEYVEYAETITNELQKVRLIPKAEDANQNTPIRHDKVKVGAFGKGNSGLSQIMVGNAAMSSPGGTELATVYSYKGEVKAGDYFMTMNALDYMTVGGEKTVVVDMMNYGDEDISFEYYLTSASGNPKAPTNPHASVFLKAGESARFVLYTTFYGNNNLMAHYEFNTGMKNGMKLGVNQYVIKGKHAEYEGETYAVTLTGGGTFAGGATSVKLKEGQSIPAVTLTGENAGKLLYGFIVDDGLNKKLVSSSELTVGTSDLALTPVAYDGGEVKGFIVENVTGTKSYVSGKNLTITAATKKITPVSYVTSGSGRIYWTDCAVYAQVEPKATAQKVAGEQFMEETSSVGSIISVSGSANAMIRMDNVFRVAKDATYEYTFNFKNVGTEKIEFSLWQINAGSWIKDGSYTTKGFAGGKVTLEAGEVKTVTITFNGFSNGNLITLFKLESALSDGKFLVSGSIKVKA